MLCSLISVKIRSVADQVALQRDLSTLERWGDTWGMRFNAGKCQIMHISRSKSYMTYLYQLGNQVLATVSESKYLGVTISDELCWSPNINLTYKKANQTLGF